MKLAVILMVLFSISIFPQKKDTVKQTKVYTLKKAKYFSKPVNIEVDPDMYTKGIKIDDDFYRNFMLLNIYTEQRKTNRILLNNEKEK